MSPLLYRVFLIPLTVFFIFMTVPHVQAAPEAGLEVKGVLVDISDKSALTARNKAFAEARRKAYQQLAAQSVPADQIANLVIPDDSVLSSMVRDFEIVNEKMTSHRYVGTMNVRFNPAVRRSFQTVSTEAATVLSVPTDTATTTITTTTEGALPSNIEVRTPIITGDDYVYSPKKGGVIPMNGVGASQDGFGVGVPTAAVPANVPAIQPQTTIARPTLVLPWYGARGRQTLWGQSNPWRDAWEANAALGRDKSIPIMLPVGDVDDMRDYSPPQPLSQRGDIDALMKRYRATDAVLALAEPAEGGSVVVSMYRFESGSPVAMGRFGVDAGAGSDSMKQAVERAVASLRAMPAPGAAQATPASVTSVPPLPTTPNAMQFVTLARFSGLQQWVNMRNALANTPGISAVEVQSISPSQAQVRFAYNGEGGGLGALLAQKGLQLSALASSAPTGVIAGAAIPQYELTAIRSY